MGQIYDIDFNLGFFSIVVFGDVIVVFDGNVGFVIGWIGDGVLGYEGFVLVWIVVFYFGNSLLDSVGNG